MKKENDSFISRGEGILKVMWPNPSPSPPFHRWKKQGSKWQSLNGSGQISWIPGLMFLLGFFCFALRKTQEFNQYFKKNWRAYSTELRNDIYYLHPLYFKQNYKQTIAGQLHKSPSRNNLRVYQTHLDLSLPCPTLPAGTKTAPSLQGPEEWSFTVYSISDLEKSNLKLLLCNWTGDLKVEVFLTFGGGFYFSSSEDRSR